MTRILAKLIPYERVIIRTSLSVDTIRHRLYMEIKPVETLFFPLFSNDKPYSGKITELGFKIMRSIKGRNSFLPLVKGVVEKDSDGSVIYITMTLHPFIIASIIVMILSIIMSIGWNGLGIVAFLYVLCEVFFWLEVAKTNEFLNKLFQNDEE